jgi:hypothetical protein
MEQQIRPTLSDKIFGKCKLTGLPSGGNAIGVEGLILWLEAMKEDAIRDDRSGGSVLQQIIEMLTIAAK